MAKDSYQARGRRRGSKEWVYGYYVKSGGDHWILETNLDKGFDPDSGEWVPVDLETVGMYLGFNGKTRLYEGDRVTCGETGEATLMINPYGLIEDTNDGWLDEWNWADDSHRFRVIGTIFDNDYNTNED